MARNIDIFMLNFTNQNIQICARTNVDCGSWTLNNNPCQLANNFTTILATQNGHLSLNASTGDNICLALWTIPPLTIRPNPPPNSIINLPVTANSSGYIVQWSRQQIELLRNLCNNSTPANTTPFFGRLFYQNNSPSPVLICIGTNNSCASLTRGINCGSNAITIQSGQLFSTTFAPVNTTAACIASWINPSALPSTAPPTNVTTIGPDSSIISQLINVSSTNVFSTTTYFSCDPTTAPLTTLNIHNCYDVTMFTHRLVNGNYVTVVQGSIASMGMISIGIPQGSMIRLEDSLGIRKSQSFTVPPAPGPVTVFFRADGTNDPTSCGTAPIIPRVTINNCNLIVDGTTQVFNVVSQTWINFQNPDTKTSLIIPAANGSGTASFPAGTSIRLSYFSSDIPTTTTDPFTVLSQATVNVSFLPSGAPSTTLVCPALPPPTFMSVAVTMNNCFGQQLNVQHFVDTVWVNLPPGPIGGGTVFIPGGGRINIVLDSGIQLRLASADTPPSITSGSSTVPDTSSTATIFFRTSGVNSGTTCDINGNGNGPPPAGSSSVTINNCFDTTLNVQTSPDGSTWTTVSGISISANGSRTLVIQQALMVRLANNAETTISGTFTVPTSSTSTVFFRSNGDVSTTSCQAEQRRTGLIIAIIVIVVVIIIIIIILIVVFSSGSKPKSSEGLSPAELQYLG